MKKVAARINITYLDTNNPNTMWKDIKTEITEACESVIKERERVSEKKQTQIIEDTL